MLLSAIKKERRKLNLRLFGNHIGLVNNGLHFLHKKASEWAYRKADHQIEKNCRERALGLKKDGFVVLTDQESSPLMRLIAEKVADLFDQPEKVVQTNRVGGILRLKRCAVEVPEIESVLEGQSVQDLIYAYFDSYFKVYSADIYRTTPVSSDVNGSFLWHLDNAPRDTLKLMVYLTDVTAETGAITLCPKTETNRIIRSGFTDREDAHRFSAEIGKSARVVEGGLAR